MVALLHVLSCPSEATNIHLQDTADMEDVVVGMLEDTEDVTQSNYSISSNI